ncbi:MAG: DUF5024 domain-containing protein [Prevotella sp.]|nr:DUF5024 domain-containing protein [Prevotella sp.]
MKQLFLTIAMTLFLSLGAYSQNKIDQLVETYSTLGSSTFTSIVDRNQQTRKVQKVVKTLTIKGKLASELKKAFKEEAETGTFRESHQDEEETYMLTVERPQQSRLYMLHLSGSTAYRTGKCTIIVKIKDVR